MLRFVSIGVLLFILVVQVSLVIAQAESDQIQQQDSVDTQYLKTLIKSDGSDSVVQPGSEFSQEVSSESREWLDKILLKIIEFLRRIGSWFERNFGGIRAPESPVSFVNLNWLIVLIIVAVLVFFFYSILPVLKRGKYSSDEQDDDDSITISLSVKKALDKSRELALRSDITGALKHLLMGYFMILDENGRIPYRKSRTNREYVRVIRRKAPTQVDFAGHFLPYMDGILYAGNIPRMSEYDKFKTQVENILLK